MHMEKCHSRIICIISALFLHPSHTFSVLDSSPPPPPLHPPSPPSLPPPRVHLTITSPPPEQKPIQARCFTPSWHVGQGRWSALVFLGYKPPPNLLSLPPSLLDPPPFLALPLPLPPGISSARRCERTAPENLCGVIPHIM